MELHSCHRVLHTKNYLLIYRKSDLPRRDSRAFVPGRPIFPICKKNRLARDLSASEGD